MLRVAPHLFIAFAHSVATDRSSRGRKAPLTAAQERDLARAIAGGSREARETLIASNYGLVVVIARGFEGRGIGLDDLISEGNIGLIRAADRFDPKFGVRFSTYAVHWIREAIHYALVNANSLVKTPAHMAQRLRVWRRAKRQFEVENGYIPSFDEVADRLGLSPKHREMYRRALRARRMRVDGGESHEDGAPLVESLEAGGDRPGEAMERSDESRGLRARMERRLDERERAVLTLRFGLDDGQPMTCKAVGERLGITREWARRIEAAAVAKLRQRD